MRNPHGHENTRRAGGFSLIEMIVVIAIMTALLAVGLSAFRSNRPEAVRSATEQVSALIEQARTSAITRRRPVVLAVVRPGQAGFTDERCRIGLFEIEDWEDGEVKKGRQIQRWTSLPSGVVFFKGDVEALTNLMDEDPIPLEWKNGDRYGHLSGLVFSARGGLLAPAGSESVVVSLGSGTYQGDEAVETGKGGRRVIRVGRVVARAWNLDV